MAVLETRGPTIFITFLQGLADLPSIYGVLQAKFSASLVLPLPPYTATCG
jgi:hypothetical protein